MSPKTSDSESIDVSAIDPVLGMGRCELEALQLERLRFALNHAYTNNPCYRRSFDAAGVGPQDLRSLEDLARFPFTTKQDLRANYPFGMFAVPRDQIVRIHASSGTTGKPTVVGYTARRHRDLGRIWWRARSAPPAAGRGDERARRLWLRPVHRRPGRPLRRGSGWAVPSCRCRAA